MNELKINGSTNILGIEVPNIEGGFSENQKVVSAKTIAEIHEMEVRKINELINNNLDEFDEGIDIMNLMNNKNLEVVAKDLGLITSNRQEYCYLLSEQGYIALVSLMRTDKAKEIRKKFRREYFTMREVINSNEQLKAKLLLDIYNGGDAGVIASKKLSELESKPLLEKIEEDKPLVTFANTCLTSKDSILVRELAKIVCDEGINIGERRLYQKLREWNYILKYSTEPTQYAMNKGYFEVIQGSRNTVYGTKLFSTSKITPRGQLHIIDKLKTEMKKENRQYEKRN